MIRRLAFCLILGSVYGWLCGVAGAASFPLANGDVLVGEPISFNAQGVVVRKEDNSFSNRVPWNQFTEAALRELMRYSQAKPFVEGLLVPAEDEVEEQKETTPPIVIKPGRRLDRPAQDASLGALFVSPVTLTLLLLIYAANLYAAYEVSIFRNYHPAAVCGVAVVAPILGPILFLCLPTRLQTGYAEHEYEAAPEDAIYEEAVPAEAAAAEAAPAAAASAAAPAQVFQRGQTTFNRRFFETKLAGFLRMVPSESEKNMLLHVKSARGEHVASRISRVTPDELYLQVVKGGASTDVMIPFSEISEVQIRHKEA